MAGVGKTIKKKFITPPLKVAWAQVHTPSVKFKPEGEYYIKVRLDPEKDSALISFLDEVAEEAFKIETEDMSAAKKKKVSMAPIYEMEEDADGEETGKVLLKARTDAVINTKNGAWDKTPTLYDSKSARLKGERPVVGSGSTVRVAMDLASYAMKNEVGVSKRLLAVQILDLIEGGDDVDFGDMSEEYDYSGSSGFEAGSSSYEDSDDADSGEDSNIEQPDF